MPRQGLAVLYNWMLTIQPVIWGLCPNFPKPSGTPDHPGFVQSCCVCKVLWVSQEAE